jgi:glycosyltransferase involved in cell wall biosynthesis/SAM-dependent methyltransferase
MVTKKKTDKFYVSFEGRHRGSRELIKSRLMVYADFVEIVKAIYGGAKTIDLGCGRGEWLEILTEQGFDAYGVDLDDGMLQSCHQFGLKAENKDALAYLKSLADQSVAIVSGFHIVEHLPFADLQKLVKEAKRVLLPGGLLIMETPNPENILVATCSFYLDPTHNHPIPPDLLLFLADFSGFSRTKILRLQESKTLIHKEFPTLQEVIGGVSPDYAVIAQKHANAEMYELFEPAFNQEYGLTLDSLVQGFEQRSLQIEANTQKAEATALKAETTAHRAEEAVGKTQENFRQRTVELVQKSEAELNELRSQIQQIKSETDTAYVKIEELNQSNHHLWSAADGLRQEINAMKYSRSWRYTRPLRWFAQLIRTLFKTICSVPSRIKQGIKSILKPILLWGIDHAMQRPVWRRGINRVLEHQFPHIRQRLQALLYNQSSLVSQFPSVADSCAANGPYVGKSVAILASGSAVGAEGGAERFYSGLVHALQEKGCRVELVCLTVDESGFEQIQQGYQEFSELDLSKFDLVISTKAPTYAANHPNHILYLVHTIRVFYDMFDQAFPHADAKILNQRDWIHTRDKESFSGIKKKFAIGHEVALRLEHWNRCTAEVLSPPIDIDGLYDNGPGDYFFMPGRLHPWKRVDLVIQAVRLSKLPLRLLISGEGEDESRLRKLAAKDSRIEFLGRVDDQKLKELYAQALAVPFVPIREDYGYITLEAFASGKAVITCTDSGEPTQFVKNDETGLVCEPNPQSICHALERLWADRELAFELGQAGRESIAYINWSTVADILLQAGFEGENTVYHTAQAQKTPPLKVAILDMQPIIPAVGGGRLRLLGLYHGLGDDLRARYVGTYDWPGERYRRHFITRTLEEIDVPLSQAHHDAAAEAARKAGDKTVIDMVFGQQAHLSSHYLQATKEAIIWADVVVFSHPWVAPLISDELLTGKTIVYDAQNVEYLLRKQILDEQKPFEKEVIGEVFKAESMVGERADLVLACSTEDADNFVATYGWAPIKIQKVPNGVFSQAINPPTTEQKSACRKQLNLQPDALVAFFIGSNYAPNHEAATFIVEDLAPALPNILFVISGGVCGGLKLRLPENVRSEGSLDEVKKTAWLHAADFAINPMFSGSGTNIKMFDFMAAGLPIVTTAVGARGIVQQSSAGIWIAERTLLKSAIVELIKDKAQLVRGGAENRLAVEEDFSWERLSFNLGRLLRRVDRRKKSSDLLASPDSKASMRIAHLSTVGLKCGIGEYTRKIIEIYSGHGIENFVLACHSANEEPQLEDLKVPSTLAWYFDNTTWSDSHIKPDALQTMLAWKATGVLIQYHPGYYSGDILYEFVSACLQKSIAVTVVVHSFSADNAETFRRLNALGVVLFSHRASEAAKAHEHGVLFDLIPLGVDLQENIKTRLIENRDWRESPPLIVTTGFLRRHKGTVNLIRAMAIVIKTFPGAILRIQCSLYPSEDSRQEKSLCEKEIHRLGIGSSVVMDTRYLTKDEIYAEINKADLAVLPYEKSNEGSSASASDCMAVGLPLIVTDVEIFDEIKAGTLIAKQDPESLAESIIQVLNAPQLYASLAQKSVAYARENSWQNVAGSLLIEVGRQRGFRPDNDVYPQTEARGKGFNS